MTVSLRSRVSKLETSNLKGVRYAVTDIPADANDEAHAEATSIVLSETEWQLQFCEGDRGNTKIGAH